MRATPLQTALKFRSSVRHEQKRRQARDADLAAVQQDLEAAARHANRTLRSALDADLRSALDSLLVRIQAKRGVLVTLRPLPAPPQRIRWTAEDRAEAAARMSALLRTLYDVRPPAPKSTARLGGWNPAIARARMASFLKGAPR